MDNDTLSTLTKIRILNFNSWLHITVGSIGFILQVILIIMQFVLAIFIPSDMAFLLLVFPILICCTALIVSYKLQKIEEELDCFEDDLEFNITGKIKYTLFNRMIEDLNRKKYHIGTELDENGYIKSWSIYNKDMPTEQYFSAENKPLLTSTKNDIFDLLNFIKEQKNV